jgi:hypothetical protein
VRWPIMKMVADAERATMDSVSKPVVEVTIGLGKWASGLELSRVAPDVVGHLKMCLLDSLGCGLFGASQSAAFRRGPRRRAGCARAGPGALRAAPLER